MRPDQLAEQQERRVRMRMLVAANSLDLLNYFARRVLVAEDSADLLSETLLIAWRRVSHLPRDDEGARMWLFGVARNVVKNSRRSSRRARALAAALRDELATQPRAVEPFSGADEVIAAVVQLPPPLQEIVTLVHWEGFTVAESARIVGISASTARGRYASAKKQLAHRLASRQALA